MASYDTSELRKGLKVQIDGVPYLIVEMNFRKPGKGNALYECKLKNLLRGTTVDRTYRAGQSIEAADVAEFDAQFLYRQDKQFTFMKTDDYEQIEMSSEQVGDASNYLKENMECRIMMYEGTPIGLTCPNHVILKVTYAEPAARGNTVSNVQKPVKSETGAEISVPAFIEEGDWIKVDTRTGEYLERAKEPEA